MEYPGISICFKSNAHTGGVHTQRVRDDNKNILSVLEFLCECERRARTFAHTGTCICRVRNMRTFRKELPQHVQCIMYIIYFEFWWRLR